MYNINKWFGHLHVLKDIDIRIKDKEKVVIYGPSGSGKSTLIRCITGLEEHQQGRIVVDGVELCDELNSLDQVRGNAGMVFQSFNLFPHMTILENCTLAPIHVKGMKKKAAEELAMEFISRVPIRDHAPQYPPQLSGGPQQRVAIARALFMPPPLLLFTAPNS